MIKHETAFLATMLLPGPYLVPTLFGIPPLSLPYPSLIPPYMYKEIATQYPCITLPLPVQDVVSSKTYAHRWKMCKRKEAIATIILRQLHFLFTFA